MYDKTITMLIKSNLGSFVKEDIFNNRLMHIVPLEVKLLLM